MSNLLKAQPEADWRLALEVHRELRAIGFPRVNLLLTGLDGPIRRVVELLQRDRQETITTWRSGHPLALSRVEGSQLMILYDVGTLTGREQLRLFEWLDVNLGRTQIVSTAPRSLLPRVQTGRFIPALYYRLNVVHIEVTG